MNVKRYFAPTAREALRALKAELGADAIVLSNRAVDGGVEILALPADAVGALRSVTRSSPPAPPPAAPAAPSPAQAALRAPSSSDDDFHVSLSRYAAAQRPAPEPRRAPAKAAEPVIRPFDPPRMETPDYLIRNRNRSAGGIRQDERHDRHTRPEAVAPARYPRLVGPDSGAPVTPPPVAAAQPATGRDDASIRELQEANVKLMGELADIRALIERQLSGFAWGETRRNAPARADIVGELLEAGFSGVLARRLADAVAENATPEAAREAVKAGLGRELRAMPSDADIIDRGGVYALVGPTGVGKTTTTAKLAARCVVRHGAEKLALITTDGYRIGAQEQLRIYGRILGVPVFSVRDGADLRQTLAELCNKHMVLIDTMGMSQRDRMVAEQAAMLMGAGSVRRLLLLNATCRGDTLADVVRAYRGPDLAGCILTKIDEAASLAPAIDVAVTHALDVFYVANGQRVPEDLHLPNRAYLLHRALQRQGVDSPWKLEGDEASLMLAAAAGA